MAPDAQEDAVLVALGRGLHHVDGIAERGDGLVEMLFVCLFGYVFVVLLVSLAYVICIALLVFVH